MNRKGEKIMGDEADYLNDGGDYYYAFNEYADDVEDEEAKEDSGMKEIATTICYCRRTGKDFHTEYASRLFKVPYDKVTKEQRSKAKEDLICKLYGKNPTTVAGFNSRRSGYKGGRPNGNISAI